MRKVVSRSFGSTRNIQGACFPVVTRPMPSDDVRRAIEDAIRELGTTLTPDTSWLWMYRQRRLDRRGRDEVLPEWNAVFPDRSWTDRLEQNMNFIDTLLGKLNRRTEISRLVSNSGYRALREHLSHDRAASLHFAAFERWAVMTTSPTSDDGRPIDDLVELLATRKNVVLEGVPGTGKTHVVQEIAERWEAVTGHRLRTQDRRDFVTMVMHPSTTYEDFVEGIRPGGREPNGGGRFDRTVSTEPAEPSSDFAVGSGFFKEVCRRAAADADSDFLVLLDEFNRCNVSSVLGDLLLCLEPSKRAARENDEWHAPYEVGLPYTKQTFFVPDNVYVVATTNTTDRSVAPLDAAIRRRFAFVRLEPDFEACRDRLPSLGTSVVSGTIDILEQLNGTVLEPCLGPDALLGHSYVHAAIDQIDRLPPDSDEDAARRVLIRVWQYDVLPQLVDTLRSVGAEDLLDAGRRNEWLAERPEIREVSEGASTSLGNLHGFLGQQLGLAVHVVGTGLSRSIRIGPCVPGASTASEVGAFDEPALESA